ncbi:MAG: hypothetical protein RLZZ206_3530, partial [Cyanobacteriota bacterium]
SLPACKAPLRAAGLLADHLNRAGEAQLVGELLHLRLGDLGNTALHQPGLGLFVMWRHGLGPGDVKDRTLLGFEPSGAPDPRQQARG